MGLQDSYGAATRSPLDCLRDKVNNVLSLALGPAGQESPFDVRVEEGSYVAISMKDPQTRNAFVPLIVKPVSGEGYQALKNGNVVADGTFSDGLVSLVAEVAKVLGEIEESRIGQNMSRCEELLKRRLAQIPSQARDQSAGIDERTRAIELEYNDLFKGLNL